MADTVEQIINDVQTVCPDVDPNLARMWVRDAGRRTMEARQWSWMLRRGHFVLPAALNNVSLGCTVAVTNGSDELTFSSAVVTEGWEGRQFRVTDSGPIYDIVGYVSPTKVRILPEFTETTDAASEFTIFKSRLPLPADCQELLSVVSPSNRWQLWLNVPQEVLDGSDPSRSRGNTNPCLLSPLDYSSVFAGSVSAPVLASGTGNKPYAGGVYTGQDDAIYTVQVTTGGPGGTAVFKWKKDEGTFTTNVLTDGTDGNSLSDGVSLRWPAATTFTVNDVFTVRTYANRTPGVPRVEVYPYPTSELTLSYWYVARHPDITDPGVILPGALGWRGDIIKEKALEFAATWQGTEERPNPARQINRRDYHAANWAAMVMELGKQDNALFQRNVLPAMRIPFAPWPFYGGRNMQEYDPPYIYPDRIY